MVNSNKLIAVALFASSIVVPAAPQTGSLPIKSATPTSVVVPLLLERSRASISVLLAGKGPYRMDIDTGFAGEVLVSKHVADQLALTPTGSEIVGDPSGARPRETTRYKLSSLRIGSLSFNDVNASEDLPIEGPGTPRDGVIGLALFRKYLLTIDYPAQVLSLADGTLLSAPSSEVIPYRLDRGLPTIKLSVGTKTIEAHVDSGGMGLSIPASVAKEFSLEGAPVSLGRIRTVSNEIELTGGNLAENIHVARFVFVKPFIEINPLFPMATLGAIPLSHFRVTIDQTTQHIQFQSGTDSIELKPPLRRSPASHP